MKKFVAILSAAALLVMPMAVCAAPSPSAEAVMTEQERVVATAAAEANMTVSEYVNNAIVSTPGLPAADTMPVAQGGKIIVNGVATNMTVTLGKVNADTVKSAKAAAATGKIINLVNAKLPVPKGNTVTVNFYVKGLVGTENVVAYQLVKGQWVPVTIKEIRADHIVLDLTQSGPVMFVQNANVQ